MEHCLEGWVTTFDVRTTMQVVVRHGHSAIIPVLLRIHVTRTRLTRSYSVFFICGYLWVPAVACVAFAASSIKTLIG